MTRRRVGPVLAEILEAINVIETHTAGLSLADFQQNWLLKLAVQRALEIVSEASRHIPEELLNLAPDIPWKQIFGIGNILRHEYHKIADDVVWAVVTEHVAPLRLFNDPSGPKTEVSIGTMSQMSHPAFPCCSSRLRKR